MKIKAAGRSLLIGVGVLLFVSAGVSIWSLERVSRLAEEGALEGAKVGKLLITAARVQTDFQVQIQEFKNVLLRGEDIDLFKKHFGSFKKRQDAVQGGLDELSVAMEQSGMDKTAPEKLLLAHSELSFRYGEAAKLVKGLGLTAAAEADRSVRGLDRETSQGLGALREAIDKYADEQAERRRQLIVSTGQTARVVMGLVTLLGGLLVLLAVNYGLRRLLAQIGGEPDDAVAIFKRIAAGDLATEVPPTRQPDSLMAEVGRMQQQLRDRVETEQRLAAETLRIKRALDSAGASMMLVDGQGQILYSNDSMRTLSRTRAGLLGPGAADLAAGAELNSLLNSADGQRWVAGLAGLAGPSQFELRGAGISLHLLAQGVFAEDGERVGTVVEWQDHSQNEEAEQQIAALIEAALRGEFDQRVPLDGKQGFHRKSAEGLNGLAKVVAEVLEEVGLVLNALANGDLTRKIAADYQGTLGQLKVDTNATVDRLREVIGQLKIASESINAAARDIAEGSGDLSRRTEEQASSLEETASSMEELSATVRQNAENARLAKSLADQSNTVAENGGQRMTDVIATMDQIRSSSARIQDIIGVIDSIAFQTNILALNAAVEAARAGEQGRGFAVVATEVRNLAHRSAQAASEVKVLIADSGAKINGGVSLVTETGRTMHAMVTDFQRLSALVTEIAHASREQSSGIDQVTLAVGQMDEVTQQNAARVEETAAAAELLAKQATVLAQTVSTFKLDDPKPRSGRVVRQLSAPVSDTSSWRHADN